MGSTKKDVEQVEETSAEEASPVFVNPRFDQVVSTGSTLLDLAISGNKVHGGGIPGGLMVEIYGPPGGGKTALLSEICASAQSKGGSIRYMDPEHRLDEEYARIYGMAMPQGEYFVPKTVVKMFDLVWGFKPEENGKIHVIATDSLAALSTEMEMEDEDKMGMRRAKEFSQELRRACAMLGERNRLLICSNQVREGSDGEVTPGGKAIPFYSSLRIRVGPSWRGSKIDKEQTLAPKSDSRKERKVKKVIGIRSTCKVVKSSVDDPFREAEISIIFNYGIDDIRDLLQWRKDMLGETMYDAADKRFKGVDQAIAEMEAGSVDERKEKYKALKEESIKLWEEIEDGFAVARGPKLR